MQQELTDLQPQLIKTSAETETLMGKIEVDTVEVEAKKEVCRTVFIPNNWPLFAKIWGSGLHINFDVNVKKTS